MTNTGFMAAIGGTYIVNDITPATTNGAAGIYVCEDTVFANLEVNGIVADVKGDYISTPGTAVKAGTLITTLGDDYFSSVTLASGSVALILGRE